LARELGKFFNRLRKEVLSALEEYWSDYQMLQGHINLICSPVHEAHREYFELLSKYIRKEYKLGQAEARRLVKQANSKYAHKSKIEMPIQGIVSTQRDDKGLFATIPQAEQDLLNRTFRTSEQTLSRVDNQINQIITDGYRSGKGINDIGNQLTKRFDQLSTWEARRIARTEVNTSHNKATMDTYKELNVEYTQWIAANDDRTRDSHAEIDGEIIPVGGHYSNGLGYPGDMSGPIEEWINCRCSNAPFVIPYGYMAPSFSPFRESDLIPIIENPVEPTHEQLEANLDSSQRALYNKYQNEIQQSRSTLGSLFSTNRERIQARHNIETTTIKLNQLKSIASGELAKGYANLVKNVVGSGSTSQPDSQLDAVDREMERVNIRTDDFDIYRLPPDEREVYLNSKKNYEILKDAIENKNYERLDELVDDGTMFIRNKETFMEDLHESPSLQLAKEEMAEYKEYIMDYEQTIKDRNISVDLNPPAIKWDKSVNDYVILKEGEQKSFNTNEKFIAYTYKKEKVTFYESVDAKHSKISSIVSYYKESPKRLQNFRRVILSAQEPLIPSMLGYSKVGGFVLQKKGSKTIHLFENHIRGTQDSLMHEGFHLMERDTDWHITNSKEYVIARNRLHSRLEREGVPEEERWVTPYARDFTTSAAEPHTLDNMRFGERIYSEEGAEFMKMYIRDRRGFSKKYPEMVDVLEDALNGKFDKKTQSYDDWIKQEKDRYALTNEELNRQRELDWKQIELSKEGKPLSQSERNELEYFQNKSELNYLHNQWIEGKMNPKWKDRYLSYLKRINN